jgi:hypothetical protein
LNQGRIAFVGTPAEFSSSINPVVSLFRDSTQSLGETLAKIRRSNPTP